MVPFEEWPHVANPPQDYLHAWNNKPTADTRYGDTTRWGAQWAGHMIPPLRSVQAMTLDYDSPYVTEHTDWMEAFEDWVTYTNHPAMNMGSIRDGQFIRSDTVPPWGSTVFGTPGIVDTMLQEITLGGRDPEAAWRDAVIKMEEAVTQWKAQHPEWQPPDC